MNGNSLMGGGAVTPIPGQAGAVGTGDFNKDGDSDILWQNRSTGQASVWEMKGNTLIGGGSVSPNPGPAWKAVGTGDFNKDGDADILFQNTGTGQVSIWEMDGTNSLAAGPSAPIPGRSGRRSEPATSMMTAFPTSFFKTRQRPSLDLGNAREHVNGRRSGKPQSRDELARHRNRWRLRHPVSKHERPSLDLGHERDQPGRRRPGQPQSRAELASRRADRIKLAHLRNSRTFSWALKALSVDMVHFRWRRGSILAGRLAGPRLRGRAASRDSWAGSLWRRR